jgi:hypothetical protein
VFVEHLPAALCRYQQQALCVNLRRQSHSRLVEGFKLEFVTFDGPRREAAGDQTSPRAWRRYCPYCGLGGMAGFENSLIISLDFIQPQARKGARKCVTNVGHVIASKAVFCSLEGPAPKFFAPDFV